MTFQLKDSGRRESWETGSQRDTREGKGRYDLLSPRFLRRLALVMERGAKKYGERNWELGQPLSRYLDSAIRHIMGLMLGMVDEDHAGQAAFNLQGFIHTSELIQEGKLPAILNDIKFPLTPSAAQVAQEGLLMTDQFENWLKDGPQSIQKTWSYFRSLGWSDNEVLDTKDALVKAGKLDYLGNGHYKLVEDAPEETLPFEQPC